MSRHEIPARWMDAVREHVRAEVEVLRTVRLHAAVVEDWSGREG